jgi:hypothetical protein
VWTAQLLVDEGAQGGDGIRRLSARRSIAAARLEEKDEGSWATGGPFQPGGLRPTGPTSSGDEVKRNRPR